MKTDNHLVRSDNLPDARSLLNLFDQDSITLMELGRQVHLIVDASILLMDIRFQVTQGVRPALIEAIDAGTVIPSAPALAHDEVEVGLERISDRDQLDFGSLCSVWDELSPKITFYDVQDEVEARDASDVRDPDDLPYLILQEKKGYPIITKDHDFDTMSGKTIPVSLRKPLRDFSRNEPYRIYFVIGSGVAISGLSSIVRGGFKAAKSGIGALRNAPPWLLVIAGVAGITLFSNKNVRDKLMDAGKNMMSGLKNFVSKAGPKAGKGITHLLEKKREAEKHLRIIEQEIGKNHRQ